MSLSAVLRLMRFFVQLKLNWRGASCVLASLPKQHVSACRLRLSVPRLEPLCTDAVPLRRQPAGGCLRRQLGVPDKAAADQAEPRNPAHGFPCGDGSPDKGWLVLGALELGDHISLGLRARLRP